MASDNQNHDQDLLLARVLQEQERAFHEMLMASIAPANKTPTREARPPPALTAEGLSDEELARRLQEQEDEEYYAEGGQQEAREFEFDADVDYDGLSYEEYNALGDVVGAVSKGLPSDLLQQLPRMHASQHKQQHCSCSAAPKQASTAGAPVAAAAADSRSGATAKDCACVAASSMCVVCQCEFEGDEMVKLLPSCGHVYHEECINQWLAGNKCCPICHKDVALNKDSNTPPPTTTAA